MADLRADTTDEGEAAPRNVLSIVHRLPVPRLDRPVRSVGGALARRLNGTYEIDEWGFDRELFDLASVIAGLRWDVVVGGASNLPVEGPALVVANTPTLASPLVIAHALQQATGRAVRFTGLPDVAPIGPILRKLGGVLARPDGVAGLLQAGHVVGVFCDRDIRRGVRVGPAPQRLIAPALDTASPVVPVAAIGRFGGRRWRVEVGPPVRRRPQPGPLAEVELAEDTRTAVQRLLDEATPPRWLFGG